MGKAAIFAGMTLSTAITAASCGPLISPPNGMMENPRDSIVDVLALVPDSLELEEWDTEGFVEPNFDEAVEDEDRPGVYMIVEQMPEFPGGDKSLFQFIADNTKYPADAKEKGIKGRVFVNFIVEPDGSVSDIRVLRGIGGGCDEEAVRIVESMPKFKPGMQNGEAVRVSYTVPVIFRLEDNQD